MLGPFDRHELADLAVNAIPLLILTAFAVVFLVVDPWGRVGLATALQFGLLLLPAIGLAYLSYRSGLLISQSVQVQEIDEFDLETDERDS